MAQKRESMKGIQVRATAQAQRLYPVDDGYKTVGIRIAKDEAIVLARALLAATQEAERIDITRFRNARSDGTYPVTVSFVTEE